MYGSKNVQFGDTLLNISVSAPVLNGGFPAAPGAGCGAPPSNSAGQNGCGCTVSPGNGIGKLEQGQNPFPVVALQSLPAFSAVVFGAGGVRYADLGVVTDRDVLVGIVTNSPTAGQLATVAYAGPVVNTVLGTGGWNFVVNQPVYVGANGQLTQTPPTVGWVRAVGFAIASNAILLLLAEATEGSGANNPPTVAVVPPSANVLVDHDSADVFDLTINANTLFDMTGGVDGRSVKLRLRQNGVGGKMFTLPTNHFLGSINLPLTANAFVIATIEFDGATGKYLVTNEIDLSPSA